VKRLAVVLALGLLAAGCGGGSRQTQATTGVPRATTTPSATTTSTGRKASTPVETRSDTRSRRDSVRSSLLANHRLAMHVLWTNHVPATAVRSTGGPALAGMKASAAGRLRKGVRVRMVRDDYRIVSLVLAPGGTQAVAIAHSRQEVELADLRGGSLGKPVVLDERARIVLRRRAGLGTYVVWRITLLK
jgi:hypothetical protein